MLSGNAETPNETEPNVPVPEEPPLTPVGSPASGFPPIPGPSAFVNYAGQLRELQEQLRAEREERELRPAVELALAHERTAAIYERMQPSNERITADQRAVAEIQLEMWKAQEPHRAQLNNIYLENLRIEQKRISDTFNAMFLQTKWAGYMFWITFLLGVFLVVTSVCAVFVYPDSNNHLIAAFFGAGALSMLAFFLRDPADKVQRTGGKLVQLQIAMRYNLMESQYWNNYFNSKAAASNGVTAEELGNALSRMRDGVQLIMRQIDESLDDRPEKAGIARLRRKSLSRSAKNEIVPPSSTLRGSGN
jgi:hypothetical protein